MGASVCAGERETGVEGTSVLHCDQNWLPGPTHMGLVFLTRWFLPSHTQNPASNTALNTHCLYTFSTTLYLQHTAQNHDNEQAMV